MKLHVGLGTLLVLIVLSGCYHSYYMEDEKWAYFEEWDTDDNLHIDSVEFVNGYLKNDFFEKWSKANAVTYEEFNNKTVAWDSTKADPFDVNKDNKISAEESAKAMFVICDQNNDGKVGSLEFYSWEIYL
ncbi:MAG TPA: hypothetical protein VFE50_02790 [Cyclobacteriaceae bacterium]|nr:hypothetical protein [Cyclobacteriaceae bacterium]